MVNTRCSTHKQDMKRLMPGHKRTALLDRGAARSLSGPQIKFHLIDPHHAAIAVRCAGLICRAEWASGEHRAGKKGLPPACLLWGPRPDKKFVTGPRDSSLLYFWFLLRFSQSNLHIRSSKVLWHTRRDPFKLEWHQSISQLTRDLSTGGRKGPYSTHRELRGPHLRSEGHKSSAALVGQNSRFLAH